MRPAILGRGSWLLVIAIVPVARILGDSSSVPTSSPGPPERPARDSNGAARPYPGVGAFGETPPPDARPGPLRWRAETRLPPEPIFSRALIPNYDLIEPDLAERPVADLFQVPPCDRWLAIERVIKKRAFREIRRHARSDWKHAYESGAPITVYEYEERLEEIHRAGRDGDVMLASEIFRSGVMGSDNEPPGGEVKVIDWGPMGLTESGRVQLDLAETLALPREGAPGPVQIVPGDERPRRAPLFTGRTYRTRTNFRFDIQADRMLRNDLGRTIDEASFAVEVDFLSRLRKKRWMELEVEVVTRDSGKVGALVNLAFILP